MIRSLKISLLFVGIMLPLFSSAQKDFGAWIGADVRVPVSKKFAAGLQLESRFKDNVSAVNQTFISPYVKYNLHKHVGVELSYRLTNRPESGYFGSENTHRIAIDLNFKSLIDAFIDKKGAQNLDFDARIRYTHATDKGELNNDYLRARLKLDYNVSGIKLTPYISTEFFFHFNDQLTYTPTEVTSRHRFNKYRINLGMEYKIGKQHELNLFYIVQPTIESPNTRFILGLGYKYSLKKKKKKKGK